MIVHTIGIKEYATIEMVLCSVAVGLLALKLPPYLAMNKTNNIT